MLLSTGRISRFLRVGGTIRNAMFGRVVITASIAVAGLFAAVGCHRGEASAKVTYLETFDEAWRSLDEVQKSRAPVIFVISAEWCGFCRELENTLLKYADGSRKVYISLADPGQTKLIEHVNELFGKVMTAHAIPSMIITQYQETTVFTQGYDTAREQFDGAVRLDGTPTGPIPIQSLFTGNRHGSGG